MPSEGCHFVSTELSTGSFSGNSAASLAATNPGSTGCLKPRLTCIIIVEMFSGLYEELKTWQAAIAALVAFGGLISAALYNAHLMRERDDRLREQDTKAVARALVSEATAITAFVDARTNKIKKVIKEKQEAGSSGDITFSVKGLADVIVLPVPRVYERCMEKIGNMPPETAMLVFEFYEHLAVANRIMIERVSTASEDLSIEGMETIIGWYEGVVKRGREAIKHLNSYLDDENPDH